MKPTVSVVMPAYNAEAFIEQAIRSVIDQTYDDWELIVIDDGSTDRTKDIVEGFDDGRIRYFYQENVGRASARNAGLDHARGEFIAFLDADDLFVADKLETQVALLRERPEITGVAGSWRRIGTDGRPLYTTYLSHRRVIPRKSFLYGARILMSTTLMRRDILDQGVRFEAGRHFAEDWEFLLRLSTAYACTFMTHEDVVASYRATPQACTKTTEDYARSQISVIENAAATYLKDTEFACERLLRRARFEVKMRMAARFYATRQAELGRRYLKCAAKLRPKGDRRYRTRTAKRFAKQIDRYDAASIPWLMCNLDRRLSRDIGLPDLRGLILREWHLEQKARRVPLRQRIRAALIVGRYWPDLVRSNVGRHLSTLRARRLAGHIIRMLRRPKITEP